MDRATAPSSAAPRARSRAARALLLCGAAAWSACALNQQGVTPPADTFFYPASAVVDPSGSWLFVTNSNADLRFNDGTLAMVNVGADQGALTGALTDRTDRAGQWAPCPQEDYVNPLPRSDPQICCWDLLDPNVLNCDERRYVQSSATVRIGSFAAGMVWQDYCSSRCDKSTNTTCTPVANQGRLLIGVRGDTSLTWVDVTSGSPTPTFACGQGGGALGACDDAHRIVESTSALVTDPRTGAIDGTPPTVNLPDEPYALALDDDLGLLYVGHLVGNSAIVDSGGVSLFDVSSSNPLTTADFIAPFPSPFPPSSAGALGVTALELHVPFGQSATSGARSEVFASSRFVPQVTAMVPFGSLSHAMDDCSGVSKDIGVVPAGDSFSSGLTGSEMRGVAFIDPPAPDPAAPPNPTATSYAQRAYALQRVPPALVGFDISVTESGAWSARPTDSSETCSSPTFLYQHQVSPEGPRLYVSCFDTGEIYVFDPTIPALLTTFQVGRGPAGLVFPDANSPIAYLIGFSDNNVSVVDVAPGSPTQYHIIQRLGFPTVTPR